MLRRSPGQHPPRPWSRRPPNPQRRRHRPLRRRRRPRTHALVEPTPAPLAGTVVEVVDGDTIRVELPSGLERVRIIGIDTPKLSTPTGRASCFGTEATAFAKDALEDQAVTLELDPTQDERDRYNQLLAHVHVGDKLYAAEAIAAGYGIHYVYERPSIHAAELDAAADTAREAGLGIWASCDGRVDLPLVVEQAPVDDPDPERPRTPTATPPTSRASQTPTTTSIAAISASRSRSSAPTSTASTAPTTTGEAARATDEGQVQAAIKR